MRTICIFHGLYYILTHSVAWRTRQNEHVVNYLFFQICLYIISYMCLIKGLINTSGGHLLCFIHPSRTIQLKPLSRVRAQSLPLAFPSMQASSLVWIPSMDGGHCSRLHRPWQTPDSSLQVSTLVGDGQFVVKGSPVCTVREVSSMETLVIYHTYLWIMLWRCIEAPLGCATDDRSTLVHFRSGND